jgi:hypothetical protein
MPNRALVLVAAAVLEARDQRPRTAGGVLVAMSRRLSTRSYRSRLQRRTRARQPEAAECRCRDAFVSHGNLLLAKAPHGRRMGTDTYPVLGFSQCEGRPFARMFRRSPSSSHPTRVPTPVPMPAVGRARRVEERAMTVCECTRFTLGKGGVVSSILTGGTSSSQYRASPPVPTSNSREGSWREATSESRRYPQRAGGAHLRAFA